MPESNIQISNSPPDFGGLIEINRQADFDIDEPAIRKVIAAILGDAGFGGGSISVAIVDDPTIHRLNVQFLQHDYETDVLSFPLETDAGRGWLEGEIVASYETAQRLAAGFSWRPVDELLLYLIHGALHLAGMDDTTAESKAAMREAETRYLKLVGRERPADSDRSDPTP